LRAAAAADARIGAGQDRDGGPGSHFLLCVEGGGAAGAAAGLGKGGGVA
jgi:hypothetical protein